jgi:hypothetical protein
MTAYTDLKDRRNGAAERYAAAVDGRFAAIDASGDRDVTVGPLGAPQPPSLYHWDTDIREDSKFWLNRATAAYFGKDSVALK